MTEIAFVDEPRSEAPVDRRADISIAEIELGRVDLRLVALDRRLQLPDSRLLLVIALPGLPSGADQLFIAIKSELSTGQLRLVLLVGRLPLLGRRCKGARVGLQKRAGRRGVAAR